MMDAGWCMSQLLNSTYYLEKKNKRLNAFVEKFFKVPASGWYDITDDLLDLATRAERENKTLLQLLKD